MLFLGGREKDESGRWAMGEAFCLYQELRRCNALPFLRKVMLELNGAGEESAYG